MASTNANTRFTLNIAGKIALLAWLISLFTLAIFVFVTIPQQKQVFQSNLESKANGLAVSLHDVAAGAAINEDYASVVSAAQTLLAGDPDLEFLIIMKNDGFSLVVEQQNWRVETRVDPYWLAAERKSSWIIGTVPMFDREVFHFAQPFDYSGIHWGWIHVGLSLQSYDESVAALYRNTIILALFCILFSLLTSLLYARQITKPIIRLQHLVQEIAEGNLKERADTGRKDELGSLAESVNTMAEALQRRDRILESVRVAAQLFLQSAAWEDVIVDILRSIGSAADADHALLYHMGDQSPPDIEKIKLFQWFSQDIREAREGALFWSTAAQYDFFYQWLQELHSNRIVAKVASEAGPDEQQFLNRFGICSFITIPVLVEGKIWGCLALEDGFNSRRWTDAEEDSFRTAADMLGATIARQQAQQALLEAKETLEQRVIERTRELQDQVKAKEQALSDLASAQNTLVEVSRAAGMAEVATGVLHNVGNVLNSVNVSCNLLMEQLRNSRVPNVSKLAALLEDPDGGIAHFLSEDPRGRQIPAYLTSLAKALSDEHQMIFKEADALSKRVEHIKEIVSMQQSYGKVSGIVETISPEQLMEDALKLNSGAFTRHHIIVVKEFNQVHPVAVDKHKVLQILLNLLTNAKNACLDGDQETKRITLRIYHGDGDKVCIEVADNGTGIAPDNLTRIFQHGFTTRKDGHGFGLHSGALAARELGGRLKVHSNGLGYGALFTLELPCAGEKQDER